jgi:hypothetical protein
LVEQLPIVSILFLCTEREYRRLGMLIFYSFLYIYVPYFTRNICDLRLTCVSKILETHISRQILGSIMSNGSESSPSQFKHI